MDASLSFRLSDGRRLPRRQQRRVPPDKDKDKDGLNPANA